MPGRRGRARRRSPTPSGTASRTSSSASAIRSGTRRSSASHARNYDLDPALLAAVIYTESRFDANARSDAGAIGLMQLLPETARGDRRAHRRQRLRRRAISTSRSSTSATARGTSATCSTGTRTSARRSPPTTRVRATSTGGAEEGVGIQFPETRSYVAKVERVKTIYAGSYATRARAASERASPRLSRATAPTPGGRRRRRRRRTGSSMCCHRFSSMRVTGQLLAEPPKSSEPAEKTRAPAARLVVGHLAAHAGPEEVVIRASTIVPGGESGVVASISIP